MPTDHQQADPSDLNSIDQLIDRARATIEPSLYGWAAAGAGEEVTVARNAIALNQFALVSKVMRDVGTVDTSTTLLGVPLSMPVVMAPVGALSLYHPDGAMGSALAAADAGISSVCGMLVSEAWEDLAATAPGRQFFQLYVGGDRAWLAGIIERVETASFAGICVTVDTPVIGRRDRSLVEGSSGRPNNTRARSTSSATAGATWITANGLRGTTLLGSVPTPNFR